MTFVYIYNAFQLTDAALMNFLVENLDFSAWMIGLVSVVGSIMAWFGITTYKNSFLLAIGELYSFGVLYWLLLLLWVSLFWSSD